MYPVLQLNQTPVPAGILSSGTPSGLVVCSIELSGVGSSQVAEKLVYLTYSVYK